MLLVARVWDAPDRFPPCQTQRRSLRPLDGLLLHPETPRFMVPEFLDIGVPQDYPARAHMQGLKRGVPVVSIPDAKPTGLVLDKERRIRLHATEFCRQLSDSIQPPVHRSRYGISGTGRTWFQLLVRNRSGPRQILSLQGEAFREGCVLARTVQVAVNPRFKGTAIRRGSRRSKISNHTNLTSMLSATPHRMSPLLESPAEYMRAAAPHGCADSRGSLGRR